MSSFMSDQIIVGNLGRDPEMRYQPSGTPVTDFSVAVNRQYTNNAGERISDVVWFRISTWGKQAEVCNQYLKKGSKVLIEGRLAYDRATGGPRVWQGQDGTYRSGFELVARSVRFLDKKGNETGIVAHADGDSSLAGAPEEDIPF